MEYETAFQKLGERYRELRTERKMVQEDVLEYNFSVRHYQQLESGRPIPCRHSSASARCSRYHQRL